MTATPVLKHFPHDDDEPETELQFPPVRGIAVSATVQGVLISAEPPLPVTADAAREVAAQLVEAAAWVDGEQVKR